MWICSSWAKFASLAFSSRKITPLLLHYHIFSSFKYDWNHSISVCSIQVLEFMFQLIPYRNKWTEIRQNVHLIAKEIITTSNGFQIWLRNLLETNRLLSISHLEHCFLFVNRDTPPKYNRNDSIYSKHRKWYECSCVSIAAYVKYRCTVVVAISASVACMSDAQLNALHLLSKIHSFIHSFISHSYTQSTRCIANLCYCVPNFFTSPSLAVRASCVFSVRYTILKFHLLFCFSLEIIFVFITVRATKKKLRRLKTN